MTNPDFSNLSTPELLELHSLANSELLTRMPYHLVPTATTPDEWLLQVAGKSVENLSIDQLRLFISVFDRQLDKKLLEVLDTGENLDQWVKGKTLEQRQKWLDDSVEMLNKLLKSISEATGFYAGISFAPQVIQPSNDTEQSELVDDMKFMRDVAFSNFVEPVTPKHTVTTKSELETRSPEEIEAQAVVEAEAMISGSPKP